MSNSTQEKRKRRRGKQGDSKVLIALEEGDPWWEVASSTQGRNDVITDKNNNNNKSVETSTVIKYRKRADELFELELTAFHNRDGTNKLRDDRWMDETMRKGTLQDRIAAMAVSCSQNPVHKLNVLDQLLNLASKEKRIATMSSEALQNLFVDVYLPPERKLILLSRRPLNDYENNSSKKTLSPRVLMLWRFEELVKERYSRFLSLLATWLNDAAGSIDVHKLNAIRTTVELLSARPEAEAQLLSMAVNKLGDPMKKAAAAAGHQLRILLESHPAMTPVVAREVQQLAHRPHLSPKALYNCVIFLNQLKLTLSQDANSLPTSLIKTYFRLFEVAIDRGDKHSSSKKVKHTPEAGKMRGRLLSALLTGVNRAHPFLPKSDEGMIEHVDALYRISHNSPPAAATQALMLLFQLAIGNGNLTEDGEASNQVHVSRKNRFYRVLYSKLGDPAIFVGRQTTMFFNLLYKAMKSDNNAARILAFAKNLLLSASHTSPGVLCASLFLVSEIMRVHPSLKESELQNVFTDFDVTKRDPDAALGPHKTGSLWEASLLSYHFHPSVSKFCGSLGDIKYNGDPCKDFSLAPFLDRFAYRNPKSKDRESKLKLGQSIAKRKDLAVDDRMAIPVNDPKFLDASNISEMDVFFHKYFTRRSKLDAWKGIERVANSTNGDKPVNVGYFLLSFNILLYSIHVRFFFSMALIRILKRPSLPTN